MTAAPRNIRNLDADTFARIKAAARARNMTIGAYLAALVDLHDVARALADTPEVHGGLPQLDIELHALGLQTVTA